MNILFITRGYPSLENPMKGNYEAIQAHAIAANGHQVSVLSVRWRNIFHILEKNKLLYRKDRDINVYEMVISTYSIPYVSQIIGGIKILENIFKRKLFKSISKLFLLQHPEIDVIHVHTVRIASFAISIKDYSNIPIVITEHWSLLNLGVIDNTIKSYGKAYKRADSVITVSRALSDALKLHFNIDSHVVNNMVENRFFEREKQKETKNDKFTFVAVGRLESIKCFDVLIKAISVLKRQDDARLIIIGEGPERSHLENLIKENGLRDVVELAGLKQPDEVAELLSKADCFVLSSKRETFGIVLIEAMAKGLPVISTRCGGPEDFVTKDCGIFVAPNAPQEMAEAMDFMMDHVNEYDNEYIRRITYEKFSEEYISGQILKVYEEAINKQRNK
jgi:glycosyltransferase involved in cell wall biosynthesis